MITPAIGTEKRKLSFWLKMRLWLGWTLLIGSIIGWPLSAIWWARHEPPFILALSWLAIILTAIDILNTVYVQIKQERQEQSNLNTT